jgi:anhydro-N-acetylmuramic acid kinase|tara:strand:+ start:10720 stop:11775 length:1056 start_codon:yes stop_codon:yes gene_type:complete
MKEFKIIGIMSGTSLDGLDIVYVNFKLNKHWRYEIMNSKTYKYEKKWNSLLQNISKEKINSIIKIDSDYTKLLSKYIINFINEFSIKKIDFISSHGHTALHQPSRSLTYQIGNLPILAKYINQKVVCDFRVQDVQLGGQGAPLVPVGEEYLFPEYDTFINLGGFANITKRIKNNIIAYDICPVNIVFNYLSRIIELKYDKGGYIASTGKINEDLYNHLHKLTYYKQDPPKSLGVEWVDDKIHSILESFQGETIRDLMNTFSNHFAFQIAENITHQDKILITGGGAYNDYLIERIKNLTNSKINIPSQKIIEYKEALIFSFIGLLRVLGINNCYSSVTGAKKDHCSGKIYKP